MNSSTPPFAFVLAILILSARSLLAATGTSNPAPSFTVLAPSVIYPDPSLTVVVNNRTYSFSKMTLRSSSFAQYNNKDPFDSASALTIQLNGEKPDVIFKNSINDVREAIQNAAKENATNRTNGGSGEPAPTPQSSPADTKAPTVNHTVFALWNAGDLDLILPWNGWGWIATGDYHGTITIGLQVGGVDSATQNATIAGVSWRYTAVVMAIIVTILLFLIVVLSVAFGKKKHKVADKSYALTAFFLDSETDCYSLSLFQFYAWTAAAIFGYITLYSAQVLIQGSLTPPDIPLTLPGVIFFSAATSIAARGITNVRGPNGAGDIYPSVADFVSTGGMIVPERFQFFVWTLVGIGTFVFMIIWTDPAKLTTLPTVSTSFLALMGISSAGYLGGKVARKPGPVVDTITLAPTSDGNLSLVIKGQKLAKNPVFQIDDQDLKETPTVTYGEADDDSSPPQFYKQLNVSFTNLPASMLTGGRHRCREINPDGQEAEWFYELPATPKVTNAKGIVSTANVSTANNSAQLVIQIQGSELSKNAIFKIDSIDYRPDKDSITTGDPDEAYGTDPQLFRSLVLTIKNPNVAWTRLGGHYLDIFNTKDLVAHTAFQIEQGK